MQTALESVARPPGGGGEWRIISRMDREWQGATEREKDDRNDAKGGGTPGYEAANNVI